MDSDIRLVAGLAGMAIFISLIIMGEWALLAAFWAGGVLAYWSTKGLGYGQ